MHRWCPAPQECGAPRLKAPSGWLPVLATALGLYELLQLQAVVEQEGTANRRERRTQELDAPMMSCSSLYARSEYRVGSP